MKLAELKRVFKNKYVIRIIAGTLTVTMIGTGAAAYGIKGTEKAFAKTVVSEEKDAESDTEQTENQLSGLLDGSIRLHETEIGKEETVYIFADSTGAAEETIVSAHLRNREEKDTLEDVSSLENITNVKGEQEYKQDGMKLTWQAGGSDIFYQGTTEKQAPVTEKLTYYLDGKEITPEELAGKSGRVTIRFDYTNHEKVKVAVDGKTEEVFVPFVAISGMVLDDSFQNVEVTNGRAIADGSKNLVIGYALPGLKESLAVSSENFDKELTIPEYVEVTADVEHFSLDMTMTAVVNATNFVSAEGENDLSSVEDMINALTDAGGQLQDGSGELAEGLDTLQSKLNEFANGVNTLKDGIKNYTDGASRVAEGIGSLKGSTPQLSDGISKLGVGISAIYDHFGSTDNQSTLRGGAGSLAAGAGQLSDGAGELSAGAGQLLDGAGSLSAGAGSVADGAKTVDNAAGRLSDGASSLSGGAANLQNGVNTLVEKVQGMADQMSTASAALINTKTTLLGQCGVGSTEELNGRIAAAEAGLSDIKAAFDAAEDAAVKNSLMESYSQTSAALASLKQAQAAVQVIDQMLSQLPSDVSSMSGELDALNQGAAGVAAGAEQISAGLKDLKNGTASLSAGASQVSAGADGLRDGASSLKAGADGLKAGADGLKDGAGNLFSGIEQLYSQAIVPVNSGMSQLSGSMPSLLSGVDLLNQGASELVSNNAALNDGVYRLSDATGQLAEGVDKLNYGAHQLSDGIVTFNESGINEIVNAWQGDAKPLFDKIQAVLDAGAGYQSFTECDKDVEGSVKFIYKTAAIK